MLGTLTRLLSEAAGSAVAPKTINRYARGKQPIPGALALYLREAARVGALADQIGELEKQCFDQQAALVDGTEREASLRAQVHNLSAELDAAEARRAETAELAARLDELERRQALLQKVIDELRPTAGGDA